ncbi:histidine phosphatase family protein [Seonamhaeicola sp. S2-3]|uniref:SixA phosphatase family protein n=1 Tax=Seonamhaeicola sp. S2-3 TaxID=1936081 RepID=UPI000972B3E4|nr:histidine phosphatase family protein [Seonamhaeicola sp. S2-3]APY12268.1 histidine phosphatase family protein [Seonamhaeicola sp. S2-3]
MKNLILIRHAKSSWEYNVIDHERPLKKRGINDARIVSNFLRGKIKSLDKILSSDALRTKLTAQIFLEKLNIDENIVEYNHSLYDFEGSDLLRVIKSSDNSINNLMIFGHNYALTTFVNTYGSEYIDNVPTSGVVVIEFDIKKWQDLERGTTILKVFPRDLKK